MRTATPGSPEAAISGGLAAPSAQSVKIGRWHRDGPDDERENQHPLLGKRQRFTHVDAASSGGPAAGLGRLCQLVEIVENLLLRSRIRDRSQLELDALVYRVWNQRCKRRSRR